MKNEHIFLFLKREGAVPRPMSCPHSSIIVNSRDRGAIFGLRGPNAELPIVGGELAGTTAIGINKFNVAEKRFSRQKSSKLQY